jgi:hypothetical protein
MCSRLTLLSVSISSLSKIRLTHSNFILAKIRSKRLNAHSLISTTDFDRTNAKIGRNFYRLVELRPNQRTKNQPIRFKTVECAQFNFDHQFWSNIFQVGRNSPMVDFLCANLGEIRPVWKSFGQFWR